MTFKSSPETVEKRAKELALLKKPDLLNIGFLLTYVVAAEIRLTTLQIAKRRAREDADIESAMMVFEESDWWRMFATDAEEEFIDVFEEIDRRIERRTGREEDVHVLQLLGDSRPADELLFGGTGK